MLDLQQLTISQMYLVYLVVFSLVGPPCDQQKGVAE